MTVGLFESIVSQIEHLTYTSGHSYKLSVTRKQTTKKLESKQNFC